MESSDIMRFCINIYADLAAWAVPCAFAFGMCNVIINSFFAAAFGGKMRIGGDK